MKKILLIINLVSFLLVAYAQNDSEVSRIYYFKIIAFYEKYDIFCTKDIIGYYKYAQKINNITVYLTYEANIFFNKCKYDENLTIFDVFYPSSMWANNRGEILRFKKRYAPVIEKNRRRKNYPYGFGRN